MRFPDPKPFRWLQLATLGLIVAVAVLTLLSGSRPAEVRWGTAAGIAALIVVVLWATHRRRRTRPNPGNTREIEGSDDVRG